MFTIRPTTTDDAPSLPIVERSAGQAFRQIQDLAWIAEDPGQSVHRHLHLIQHGGAWVAVNEADNPIGFLNGEVLDGNFHIWEISVHRDYQGKGIGRALMATVKQWAMENNLPAITLTTFRDVPWNEPFYQSMGFMTLSQYQITPMLARVLDDEVKDGVTGEKRCAMRLSLQ